jgi:hypothetical protein
VVAGARRLRAVFSQASCGRHPPAPKRIKMSDTQFSLIIKSIQTEVSDDYAQKIR